MLPGNFTVSEGHGHPLVKINSHLEVEEVTQLMTIIYKRAPNERNQCSCFKVINSKIGTNFFHGATNHIKNHELSLMRSWLRC
jgi:hypothetical protein